MLGESRREARMRGECLGYNVKVITKGVNRRESALVGEAADK
jgi:hypothetical protein